MTTTDLAIAPEPASRSDGRQQGGWTPKQEPALAGEVLARWRSTTRRLGAFAERAKLSRTEVSRRCDVPLGTLSPWYDGSYTGNYDNVAERVAKWLDAEEDRSARMIQAPETPDYVEIPTSIDVWNTLMWAQTRPGMVVITLGSGMGKTITSERYCERVPGSHLVTMRPTTRSPRAMLLEIGRALDVTERSSHLLDSAIGAKLRAHAGRKTLLIIDEAQNLEEEAVNQLRWLLDIYRCGIALVGNLDVQSRYGGASTREGYGQIHSRVSKRLLRLKPRDADIAAIVASCGVTDPAAVRLLTTIGKKPGALRQIVETVQLARLLALGSAAELSVDHVRDAWINRGNEDIR